MNREALVITGLTAKVFSFSDEVPVSRKIKSDAEKFLSDGLGIKTKIFESDWKIRGCLQELRKELFDQIEGVDGEVVLIGLSAGTTVSLIAKDIYGKKISKIISICGWTREDNNLTNFERKKLDALRLPNPVFGEAIETYARIHNNFMPEDWNEVMGMWAEHDQFIPRSCCVHKNMGEVISLKSEHVSGILLGLTKTGVMRRFIEVK